MIPDSSPGTGSSSKQVSNSDKMSLDNLVVPRGSYANSISQFPRKFVPENLDLSNWSNVEPIYQQLAQREITSARDLERWLLDESELESCLSEECMKRDVARTRNTDDPKLLESYESFLRDINENAEVWRDRLNRKYLDSPFRALLDSDRYQMFDKAATNEVSLFREANVPLETKVAMLVAKYQEICAELTVNIAGKDYNIEETTPLMQSEDRGLRQETWNAVNNAWKEVKPELDALYQQMFELRQTIAKNAGFDSYREYAFKEMMRDYNPADCLKLHESIESCIVPLAREITARRKSEMQIEDAKPWDISWDSGLDPKGRPALQPYYTTYELTSGVSAILGRIAPVLQDRFGAMRDLGLLDLEARPSKAAGGYNVSLDERRLPFIFMNASRVNEDVMTLLHEFGHANHVFESRDEPLFAYRDPGIEICEVASMTMELLGSKHLDIFYTKQQAERAVRENLEKIVLFLPYCAQVDAFQHWVYTNAGHSAEERDKKWKSLSDRFSIGANWAGQEEAQASGWHRKEHIFTVPFYYIEYAIAQFGALQLWQNSLSDEKESIRKYRSALSLGAAKSTPELFDAAGIKFDFSHDMVNSLTTLLRDKLKGLDL